MNGRLFFASSAMLVLAMFVGQSMAGHPLVEEAQASIRKHRETFAQIQQEVREAVKAGVAGAASSDLPMQEIATEFVLAYDQPLEHVIGYLDRLMPKTKGREAFRVVYWDPIEKLMRDYVMEAVNESSTHVFRLKELVGAENYRSVMKPFNAEKFAAFYLDILMKYM